MSHEKIPALVQTAVDNYNIKKDDVNALFEHKADILRLMGVYEYHKDKALDTLHREAWIDLFTELQRETNFSLIALDIIRDKCERHSSRNMPGFSTSNALTEYQNIMQENERYIKSELERIFTFFSLRKFNKEKDVYEYAKFPGNKVKATWLFEKNFNGNLSLKYQNAKVLNDVTEFLERYNPKGMERKNFPSEFKPSTAFEYSRFTFKGYLNGNADITLDTKDVEILNRLADKYLATELRD